MMKTMIKTTLLLLALLLPVTALAHDFEVDGIFYNIINGNEVEVTYSWTEYSGDVVIPETVTHNGVTYFVTAIGNKAFLYCHNLTGVSIPNFVTAIGNYAFYECYSLNAIHIPHSVEAIGMDAFSFCSGLTSITIDPANPNYDSRDDCNAIIETSSNKLITGCNNTVIPNTVTTIARYAFFNCTRLTSVNIPSSVTSIGYQAFGGCSGITSITIDPANPNYDSRDNCNAIIETAKNELITGCNNTIIPNTITTIGNEAFSSCAELSSVTIPTSVTSIGWGAFTGCIGLESMTVANENPNFDSRDNCNAIIETASNTLMYGCRNTIIPNSVTTIGSSAFDGCTTLKNITIPNSITSFETYAFYGCTGLTEMIIPNSVTTIGYEVFLGCTGLTRVIIPNSVTAIGFKAFGDCNGLNDVYCYITDPSQVSMEDDVFYRYSGDYPTRTLHVVSNQEAYQNDIRWSQYFDRISVPEVDGIYYNINGNEAIVTYGDNRYTGDVSIPPTVTIDGTEYTVTSIGERAFFECSELTSVSIPNTITSIGSEAFHYCYSLERANITDIAAWCTIDFETSPLQWAHHLYLNGTEVTDLIIPETVTHISDYAFRYCTGLTSVVIPNSVTSLGRSSFAVTGLTSVVIPGSVKTIGNKAFQSCQNLTDVTLSEGLTLIDEEAFCETGITEIHLPESLVRIGEQAFEHTFLTSITIPKNVAYLGNEAEFENDLYGGVFDDCPQLMEVNVDPANATYASYNGMLLTKNMKTFLYCPDGWSGQCVIPNSVTTIGSSWGAFDCKELTSVIIPSKVEFINDNAFSGCSALTLIRIFAVNPPSVGYYPFSYNSFSNATLEVPAQSVEAYRAHQYWGRFQNIQPIVQASGDVDGDGQIGIGDVADLIDLLLGGNVSLDDCPAADVDGDCIIGIADVADLIDRLLSGN